MRGESRFYALDGIRGLAALAVAAYHYGAVADLRTFPGYLAVDLFFVLSGFVIAMNYGERLSRGIGTLRFMVLRMERLYPLWLLGCLVALAHIVWMGGAATAPRWLAGITVANLLMLPAPADTYIFPLNMPGWSLFFEVLVNIAFAAMLWRLRNGAIAAIMLASAVMLGIMAWPHGTVNLGSDWPTIFGGVPRTLFSFLAGVMVFRLGAATARRATWLSLVPAALALLAILWTPPLALRLGSELLWVLALFPLLVGLAARWESPAMLQRACKHLGDISYPVYVLHVPVMFIGSAAAGMTGSAKLGLPVFLVVLITLSLPAASADRVVRGWIRRFTSGRDFSARQKVA